MPKITFPLAVVVSMLAPRCFESEDFHVRDITHMAACRGHDPGAVRCPTI